MVNWEGSPANSYSGWWFYWCLKCTVSAHLLSPVWTAVRWLYRCFVGEKAIKKKQICMKLVPRNTTESAIIDLILLSRSKRAPPEYILTGFVQVPFHLSVHKPISSLPIIDEFSLQWFRLLSYCLWIQHCCSTFNYEVLMLGCATVCLFVCFMPAPKSWKCQNLVW